MTIEANAKITLRGGSEALKSLQGINRETTKAGNAAKSAAAAQEAAAKKAADAIKKEDERWAKAAQASAAVRMRAQEQAAAKEKKIAEQASKAAIAELAKVTRAAEREAAKQVKLAEKTAAAEVKAKRDSMRQIGGLMVAAGVGAAAGIGTAIGVARGNTQAKSLQERVQAGNDFRSRLIITTKSAGLSDAEREDTQGKILAASKATGTDQSDLLGAVETGQAKFNDLKFFRDNLMEIATISKSAGANTEDLSIALGYMRQGLELTDAETLEAAYLIKSSADKGSIEVANFAKDMAAGIGIFAKSTGQRGLPGVRQLLGVAQGIGTGGFDSKGSAAEAGTRFERLSMDLNDKDVKKGLAGIGVKGYQDKSGKIDVLKLIDQLTKNKKFQNATTRQEIFKDIRGLSAIETLMSAREHVKKGASGAVDAQSIAGGIDAAQGRGAVTDTFDTLSKEGGFKNEQRNAAMQADTMQHLSDLNDSFGFVRDAADTLETSFGALSAWASSIAALGVGSVVTAALQGKLAGGAAEKASGGMLGKAGSAVAGAAGSALGALGTGGTIGSIAAAGGLAGGAIMAGGAAIAGGAGVAAGYGLNEWVGSARDDKQNLSDLLANAIEQIVNSGGKGGGEARNRIGATIVNERGGTRVIEATLKSIDDGLRAQANKPQPGAARGPK